MAENNSNTPGITIGKDGSIIRHNYRPPAAPQPAASSSNYTYRSPYQSSSYSGSEKRWGVLVLLSFFLGWLGLDRFYAGRTGLGIAKIIAGFFGIGFLWWVVDLILALTGRQKDSMGNYIKRS